MRRLGRLAGALLPALVLVLTAWGAGAGSARARGSTPGPARDDQRCILPAPGPIPIPLTAPGNPQSTFCEYQGTFGWSGQAVSGGSWFGLFGPDMTCDGVRLPFDHCFPGLHYVLWMSDYYLGWEARDYLSGAITLLVSGPDVSRIGDAGGPAATIETGMENTARSLAALFIVVTMVRTFLRSLGRDSALAQFAGAYRAILGFGLLLLAPTLLGLWFAGINTLTQALIPANFSVFPLAWLDENTTTPAYYLSQASPYYSHGAPYIANQSAWWVLAFLVVLLTLFITILLALFVRFSGLFALIALFLIAPLCIVTWILPEFSPIARWWWASFVSYSLWGVAYAVVLLGCAAVVGDGSTFAAVFAYPGLTLDADQTAFFQTLVGVAGLLTMTRIPELMEGVLGGLSARASGVAGLRGGAVGAARGLIG